MQIHNQIESAIITTNYDLLIEEAIEHSKEYKLEYFTDTNLPLLKLHGSVNFLPWLVLELLRVGVAYNGLGVHGQGTMAGPVQPVSRGEALKYCSHNIIHPCMALYEKGKEVVVCPALIKDLQTKWQSMLVHAENVFVVGMKVIEEDTHIWGELAKTKANVFWYGKIKKI